MNGIDILLLILIAAAFLTALARCVRNAKRGRPCCGDCAACAVHRDECGVMTANFHQRSKATKAVQKICQKE